MKLFTKAVYTGAGGYSGATALSQRTLLWEALQTAGLTDANRTTVTATATLTVAQCGLLMGNVAGASIVSTLPVAATAVEDAVYLLKRLDTSANSWTIAAGAANTIEGQASVSVPPGGILGIQLPGGSTDWKIIGVAGNPAVLPTGGTLTAYTLTPPIPITAYARGLTFPVSFTVASGLNPTLAISAIAAPPNLVALQSDGTFANITAGQIPAGHISNALILSATQAWVVTMPPASVATGHGQCLLEYVSTTQIRLRNQNGNRLIVNGVSCAVPDTPLTLAATGLQPVFASATRAITTNVATITHAALAAALPVGSQVLALDVGGAEVYNGLKTVTASTTTSTSYAAVATNEASVADTAGRITPIYHTYAVATAGAISSIEASLTVRATSTATGNKGVEIRTGDETRTFVGTFTVAAGPVFANTVQSRFNGRAARREYFSVLASRAANVSYPNGTLQDMQVLVSGTAASASYVISISVDGVTRAYASHNDVNQGAQLFLNATVPPGSSYQVNNSTPSGWTELRLP